MSPYLDFREVYIYPCKKPSQENKESVEVGGGLGKRETARVAGTGEPSPTLVAELRRSPIRAGSAAEAPAEPSSRLLSPRLSRPTKVRMLHLCIPK